MKNVIYFVVSLILIFNSGIINAQKTHDNSGNSDFVLTKDKPSFTIKFPGKYKLEESKEEKGLKTEMFRSEIGNEVYMLKYTEHSNPAVASANEHYMDASLESFITGIKASLIKKSDFKFNKSKGLEAYLSLDNKNMNVFYRVLIIKKVQYQLIVITKAEEKNTVINNFFKSFICPVKK
ncbi:MAG: hypothetical protein K8R54_05180 [Bacteroidales bacterium]|nr:hypothetical protein [Bacteroidales bacterium]